MKLVCISDLHGMLPKVKLPDADVLVIAGDVCKNYFWNKTHDAQRQLVFLENELYGQLDDLSGKFKHIVMIPGNHDKCFELFPHLSKDILSRIINLNVLIDDEVVLDGVKFYGSPWTPWFHGDTWSFNFSSNLHAQNCWRKIPDDVDVLVTHGPPYGVGDLIDDGEHVGCEYLLDELENRIRPQVHIWGHIHESYGRYPPNKNGTEFINAATCDLSYSPKNAPIKTFVSPR